MGPLAALRELLGRKDSRQQLDAAAAGDRSNGVAEPGQNARARLEGQRVALSERLASSQGVEHGEGLGSDASRPGALRPSEREGCSEGTASAEDLGAGSSARLAHHVMAYLSARAEESLGLLLAEVSCQMARELGEAVESTRRAIFSEIGQLREGMGSSQRELSRVGRQLVRSGAALESTQTLVAAIAQSVQRLETELRTEQERDARLRDEVERAAISDMLATLDGLEAGLEDGRVLISALSDVQHRLKDTAVQRWWRAMAEATGIKRPLPEVPVAELESWMGGLELTRRRLLDALARRNVTPIDAVGGPFDPYLHEAVAVESCPPEQDGLVLREERRGYRTPERVIRLSQVVVGKAGQAKAESRRRCHGRRVKEGSGEDGEPPSGEDPARGSERQVSPSEVAALIGEPGGAMSLGPSGGSLPIEQKEAGAGPSR